MAEFAAGARFCLARERMMSQGHGGVFDHGVQTSNEALGLGPAYPDTQVSSSVPNEAECLEKLKCNPTSL